MSELRRRSTRRGRTRPGCTTTSSAGRTTSRPTARRRTKVLRHSPYVRTAARENRAFLGRAVRYLAAEAGHPAVPRHRHRAAHHEQRARGRAGGRAVLPRRVRGQRPAGARARAGAADLRPRRAAPPTSTPTCATRRRSCPTPVVREVLDFSQPIALMLVAILHFIPDEYKPGGDHRDPARRPAARQLPRRLAPHDGARPEPARPRGSASMRERGDAHAAAGLRRVRLARVLRPRAGAARRGARVGVAAAGTPGRGRCRPR